MTSDLHQTLMATAAEPAFHEEPEAVWGRPWGAHDEVGQLVSVLARPPGPALELIRADAWDAERQALIDPDGGQYWTRRQPPDPKRAAAQHDGLVVDAGVEAVTIPYDELHPNGGGIHCSTMELIRQPAS